MSPVLIGVLAVAAVVVLSTLRDRERGRTPVATVTTDAEMRPSLDWLTDTGVCPGQSVLELAADRPARFSRMTPRCSSTSTMGGADGFVTSSQGTDTFSDGTGYRGRSAYGLLLIRTDRKGANQYADVEFTRLARAGRRRPVAFLALAGHECTGTNRVVTVGTTFLTDSVTFTYVPQRGRPAKIRDTPGQLTTIRSATSCSPCSRRSRSS